MKYLLDTCILSYFVRGEGKILERLKQTDPSTVAISTITNMELEFGLQLNKERAKKIKPILEILLNNINILPFTVDDAHSAAIIRAHLKRKGTPIGPYNILLAGCALNRNLIFVTANDKEFNHVTGLHIENWNS